MEPNSAIAAIPKPDSTGSPKKKKTLSSGFGLFHPGIGGIARQAFGNSDFFLQHLKLNRPQKPKDQGRGEWNPLL